LASVTSHPEDIVRLLDALRAVDAEARAIGADLDDDAFNRSPEPGRAWSVAQCFDHMTRTGRAYLAPLRDATAEARQRGLGRRGPIDPGYFGGLFLEYLEPPPRFRFPAPGQIRPGPGAPKLPTLQAFLGMQTDARALVEEAAGLDLNRARFVNPFVPGVRFRVGTGFLIIAGHNRRHLWQARRVREAIGLPVGS
jgi:hypothetical protein